MDERMETEGETVPEKREKKLPYVGRVIRAGAKKRARGAIVKKVGRLTFGPKKKKTLWQIQGPAEYIRESQQKKTPERAGQRHQIGT